MKKIYSLLTIGIVTCLLLALLAGCQGQLDITPEPESATPSVPSSEEPSVLSPSTQIPSVEPSTTPEAQETAPEPSPTSTQPESTPSQIGKSVEEPSSELEDIEPYVKRCAFIKFDGVDGESQISGHEGWSEIVSFSQSIVKPSSGTTDTTRRRGDVILEDIVVVKEVDKATPKLAEAICRGTVFTTVEIHFTGPSEGSTYEGTFLAYELKNVQITSHRVTGSDPLAHALVAPAPDTLLPYSGPFIVQAVDAPMEEITLNFEEIKVTYTESDSTGKAKGNVEYSWKVEEGES